MRIFKYTDYRNSPLPTIADRLFFILVYLKNNPLQEYHAACFDMGQKHCNTFIHGLNHILHLCLCNAGAILADTQKELSGKLEQLCKNREPILFHDGTEREIPRSVDPEEQQENYSGKKKKNTLKNGVIATALCVILFVSQSMPGKMDKK